LIRRVSAETADLILVVDDDIKICKLVEAYLVREGYRVALASDGLTALRLIRKLSPALVVLDLMLPDLDGFAVARTAREEGEVSIIMLTAMGSTPERVQGLNAGADDYLAKPFSPSELVARIRSVLRRTRPRRSGGVIRHGDITVDRDRRTARLGTHSLDLTATEFELLDALVEARGRVLTRDLLIDLLHPTASDPIQGRSINVYVRRLRSKLGDDAESPRHLVTVRGVGYRLAGT
jgi:DNA-binding response OmpR family regulator